MPSFAPRACVAKHPLALASEGSRSREWSRDGCEAIGSDERPWVAAESPENGRNTQIGKQARRSCSGGRWRPEMGGLGRQGTVDEVVKKWWPEVERRRRIGAKTVRLCWAFSGQTAGRLGVGFGGVVHRREGKRMGPVGGQTVAGRRRFGLLKGRRREGEGGERERERARGGGGFGRGEERKEKKKKKKKKRKRKGKEEKGKRKRKKRCEKK
ncbi:hypothetical protein CIPAW_12G057600 [Carya illinoinensis]|uniref:Uncharacterized protein n=1 Tax=Carya illinoinensis TaxID=32201 RepID=A0A8T1NXZ1_CARIL|nr:hypothetical protein CIPAW_12G057600 [Carya illinoinensis]